MSPINIEEAYDSLFSHRVIKVVGSILTMKEFCCIAMHRGFPFYIFPNTFIPVYESLRRDGNTDRREPLSSTESKTMNSSQPTQIPSTSALDTSAELSTGAVSGLRNLTITEDGSHDDDDDDDDDDDYYQELDAVYGYPVDLVAQENQHKRKPIYTRELLNDVKLGADQIHKELSLEPNRRELHHLNACGMNQKSYRIWESDGCRNANFLQVQYLSRVEMDPGFQERYDEYSHQIKALRRYNKDHKHDCIDTPYTFITFERKFFNEHLNNDKMKGYWEAIMHTKSLWIASSSRRMLMETFLETAKTCTPITQVVCFGLGALNLKKNFYHSAIQYMAVFTIIQTLDKFYLRSDPTRSPIKLILQDPNYELRDHQILRKMFKDDDTISFVSDPEGLLAIDAGTLVVTAFLPVQMPLVQIIADLFSKEPTQGPAAIICDIMEVNAEKREYCLGDRDSPAAARFFTGHYEKAEDGFDDHGLDDELMADAYGEDWAEKNRLYWLNMMDLWVRKVGAN